MSDTGASGASADDPLVRAADPTIAPHDLAILADRYPATRPIIAQNPMAYAELLTWLASLDDPAVDAALAARLAPPYVPPATTGWESASAPGAGYAGPYAPGSGFAVPGPGMPGQPGVPGQGGPGQGQPALGAPGQMVPGQAMPGPGPYPTTGPAYGPSYGSGYGMAPATWQPFVAPRTSGLAVASLVLGILGLVVGVFTLTVLSVLAIVLGHVALSQTKNDGTAGRGLALAGCILGYIGFAGYAALYIWAIVTL